MFLFLIYLIVCSDESGFGNFDLVSLIWVCLFYFILFYFVPRLLFLNETAELRILCPREKK